MLSLDKEIDIAQFFKWWGQELRSCLPKKIQDTFKAQGRLIILIEQSKVFVSYYHEGITENLAELELNALAKEDINNIIKHYKEATVVLRIPKNQVVSQDIFLPVATEANLAQVMAYELDRYTPFTAKEVYFSYIKLGYTENKAALHLRLVLTKKETLEKLYEQIVSLGLKPAIADADMQDSFIQTGSSGRYNLLPEHLCLPVNRKPLYALIGSLLLMVSLLVALLILPLQMGAAGIDKLKQHARQSEALAFNIEDSKKSLDYLYRATQQLVNDKNETPAMVDIINTLSQALPDDTWVSYLRYNAKNLQLTGQSANASSLIAILEKLPFFQNVKFVSSVTKDRRTSLERFQISIDVASEQHDATK